VLSVKLNSRDFPNVESISPWLEGAKCPTLEQCKDLTAGSESIPF
jgi:hypothetical protein